VISIDHHGLRPMALRIADDQPFLPQFDGYSAGRWIGML
jgi:hypothetical protein